MSYRLDGDWRVWQARLVGDVSALEDLLRAGVPSLSIAAGSLEAMGRLAAEWHKAVAEFDKTYQGRLSPEAVEQLQTVVRYLDDLSVLLLMVPDVMDPHRQERAL